MPYTRLPELRARVGGALLCVYRHRPRPGRAASHSRRWLVSRARPHRRGGPTLRG